MNSNSFSALGLSDALLKALNSRNHTTPTPIQTRSIPELLNGRDILGVAQTGTGKTAAFALPILHHLEEDGTRAAPRKPRALILAPTRELAIQIGEEFRAYSKNLNIRSTVIFGGVSQKKQVDALNRGIDILVATPGRLLDLRQQGYVRFSAVEFFVLDEADRMLDMGFIRDIRKIVPSLPEDRQSLLFSATMPKEIAGLAGDILSDPVRVEVTPQATPIERIKQTVYHLETGEKGKLLETLLSDESFSRVIVFARMKHRANRIAEQLCKAGIKADAIHGNKSQNARQRALQDFKNGKIRVLVATDIAARGIDIDQVSHVINYELPNEPDSYVHRIGRTARAGAAGAAISFCDRTERAFLRDIERLIKTSLTVIGDGPRGEEQKPAGRGNRGQRNRPGNRGGQKGARPEGAGKPRRSRNRRPNRNGGTRRAA